jgi:transcriptional regulator with XRE-family HTH domain
VATNLAAQIAATRRARGWTQEELAKRADMAQSRIPLLEDPSYGNYTLKTLKRLASAFDVALIVKFAPFSEFIGWVSDQKLEDLCVPSFEEDRCQQEAQILRTWVFEGDIAQPPPLFAVLGTPTLEGRMGSQVQQGERWAQLTRQAPLQEPRSSITVPEPQKAQPGILQ